jgi:hypothetical protein
MITFMKPVTLSYLSYAAVCLQIMGPSAPFYFALTVGVISFNLTACLVRSELV